MSALTIRERFVNRLLKAYLRDAAEVGRLVDEENRLHEEGTDEELEDLERRFDAVNEHMGSCHDRLCAPIKAALDRLKVNYGEVCLDYEGNLEIAGLEDHVHVRVPYRDGLRALQLKEPGADAAFHALNMAGCEVTH